VLSDLPSIYADPALMKDCMKYMEEVMPGVKWDPDYRITASDDFGRVAELVPSTFFAIGAKPADGNWFPNHNSNVVFNEDCLVNGAASFAQIALRWLEEHK